MFDLISFAETHSAWVVLAVILGVAVLWLAGREIRDIWHKNVTMLSSVLTQEESIKAEDEQTIIYRREILELAQDARSLLDELKTKAEAHYADVERLSSDDHWKNCNVDKCPNMPNILASLRQNNESLTEILTQLRQLAFEIIATLRSFRNGSGSGREDNAR